ncbi:hypothetical protein [Kitasatospora sp. NPDC059571]|uniref:hypothetical protein n=1 Tax=Kitasatospora sp. NPDC059571 TaxID=3346871 RepID=UPI0036B682D3
MTNTNQQDIELVQGRAAAPGGGVHSPGVDDPSAAGNPLAGFGPWSVRCASGRRGRAALEIYEDGELLDVMVSTALGDGLLRGARRCAVGSAGTDAFAWGRLPSDGTVPPVVFTAGWLTRRSHAARAVPVLGRFWLARCTADAITGVAVRQSDGLVARLPARQAS